MRIEQTGTTVIEMYAFGGTAWSKADALELAWIPLEALTDANQADIDNYYAN